MTQAKKIQTLSDNPNKIKSNLDKASTPFWKMFL